MAPAAQLIVVTLLVYCGQPAGGLAICGFETTARVQSASQEFLVIEESPGNWSLQMNVTWPVPDHDGHDGYYIQTGLQGKLTTKFGCTPGEEYEFTSTQWFVFRDIHFGHEYEIWIKLYNTTTEQSALYAAKFYPKSPDCYESTSSIEFCLQQPIETASKIREPLIESIQVNQWGNGTDVGISWLPPVQINGELRKIVLSYRPSDQISYEDIENFPMTDIGWDGDRSQRFSTLMPSLQSNTSYVINIKPLVQLDDGPYFGDELELLFNTSTLISNDVTSTATPTTSTSDITTSAQTTVSSDSGGVNSAVAFIKEEWQWLLLCVAVVIILLIATVSMVMYCNRRKSNERTVTIVP